MNLRRYIYEHYIKGKEDAVMSRQAAESMLCRKCPIYVKCYGSYDDCEDNIRANLDMEVPDDFT